MPEPKPIDPKVVQRDTLLLKKQMDDEAHAFADKLILGNVTPLELESVIDAFVGQLIPHVANYTRKILRKHGVQPNVILGGSSSPAKKPAKDDDS